MSYLKIVYPSSAKLPYTMKISVKKKFCMELDNMSKPYYRNKTIYFLSTYHQVGSREGCNLLLTSKAPLPKSLQTEYSVNLCCYESFISIGRICRGNNTLMSNSSNTRVRSLSLCLVMLQTAATAIFVFLNLSPYSILRFAVKPIYNVQHYGTEP